MEHRSIILMLHRPQIQQRHEHYLPLSRRPGLQITTSGVFPNMDIEQEWNMELCEGVDFVGIPVYQFLPRFNRVVSFKRSEV